MERVDKTYLKDSLKSHGEEQYMLETIGSKLNDSASPDLVLSNLSLGPSDLGIENGVSSVRLSWNDLSVAAELPQPSGFKKLRYRCMGKPIERPKTKPIIRNVTGAAEPGSLLAIMGASGAGKTTLLNVLSRQNVARLQISGTVLINGKSVKNKIKTISAYVQQEDLFIGTLTVKEHLTFQALLRMDKSYSRKQKMQRVEDVINQLGLMKCQNTIIGVPGRIRGISGGENKRLSFASEIITNPKLLFVDEPTSGLDAFMAESVITALQKIASEGRTILATIHQPSSEVFQLFDRLLLLSEGRTAFLGSTKDAIGFFESVGHPCPLNYNPADHYIHTLAIIPGNEEECKAKSNAICDSFSSLKKDEIAVTKEDLSTDVFSKQSFKAGFFSQLRAVLWRCSKSNQREPFVSKLRIGQAVLIALIAGLAFLRQDNDQDGVSNLNGALFFTITTLSFNSMTGALFIFPAELPVFLKEHKLAMYRPSIYFWSKTLAELPWYILSTALYSVIIYFMTGMRETASSFFLFVVIAQLISQCALSFGYLVSAIAPTVQVATSMGPPLLMPFLLFGGFFIKDNSIPVFFIWLQYISWFKYAFELLQINQWDGYGMIECDKVNQTGCILSGEAMLKKNGFDADNFGPYIGIMAALVMGFRILAFLFVLLRASRAK